VIWQAAPRRQQEGAVQTSDRRSAPRFRIAIPLLFRLTKSYDCEYSAETLDISSRGLRLETDAPLCTGAILALRLRMPEMIIGWRAPEWHIIGHTIHVQTSVDPDKYEAGVEFDYYEPVAPYHGRLIVTWGHSRCA